MVRWQDTETDQLLEELAATEGEPAQKEIAYQLQDIMMEQFPVVPLWYGAKWFEYRTENAVGWPSEKNPYAHQDGTNALLIITHLRPPGDG
jgi:peptide/nickel transport system substrate-binding protein